MLARVSDVREIIRPYEDFDGIYDVGVVVLLLQDDAVLGAKDVITPGPHVYCVKCSDTHNTFYHYSLYFGIPFL